MEYFPCVNQSDCPLSETVRGCFEDVHHKQFPKNQYRTKTERLFRELEDNKELTCRFRHQEIHATQPTPDKPSVREMQAALGWLAREATA